MLWEYYKAKVATKIVHKIKKYLFFKINLRAYLNHSYSNL